MSVHTGTYHFEVSRTAMSPEAYVPAHTGTYRLVPPYSRCTGFQMHAQVQVLSRLHNLESSGYPPGQDSQVLVGQNCTYVSEHGTDMYIQFHVFMKVYVHVHEY
jgi:hypothetical protein